MESDRLRTLVTRLGPFRSFNDLSPSDLFNNHTDAQRVARYILSEVDEHEDELVMDGWLNHEHALLSYGAAAAHRLWQMNFKGVNIEWWRTRQERFKRDFPGAENKRPAWSTNPEVIYSHRSHLMRSMDKRYIGKWARPVSPDCPILWPKLDRTTGSYELFVSEREAASDKLKLPDHLVMNPETRKVTKA